MAKLRISETFESVQGEGIRSGVPSLFIRVSGCNLRCVWCDTPYASWQPEGEYWDIDELIELAAKSTMRDVVITGGEPMLFDGIERLTEGVKAAGKTITIETAGTMFREIPVDLMSISPKLSNSAPPVDTPGGWHQRHEDTRSDLEPLSNLISCYECQLKFVVADIERDVSEIKDLLSKVPAVENDKVLLMPEGRDSEQLWSSMRRLVPIAMAEGWRICPRLQIDLFGDTKGT